MRNGKVEFSNPRLLSSSLAAEYLGISERSFIRLLDDHILLNPVRIGRRVLWDKKVLDLYVDYLSNFRDLENNSVSERPW